MPVTLMPALAANVVTFIELPLSTVQLSVVNLSTDNIKFLVIVVITARGREYHGLGKRYFPNIVPGFVHHFKFSFDELKAMARTTGKFIQLTRLRLVGYRGIGSVLIVVLALARDIPKMPREHEAPVVGDTLELHSVTMLDDLPVCMAFNGVPLHLKHLFTCLISDKPSAAMMIPQSSESIVPSK